MKLGPGTSIPKNYLLDQPLSGSLIAGVFTFVFLWLYRPQLVSAGQFPYILTIAIYSLIAIFLFYLGLRLVGIIPRYQNDTHWILLKELESMVLVLFVTGTGIYFAGFLTEGAENRWNLATYLDSLMKTFLIGCIPFLIFTSFQVYQFLTWGSQYRPMPSWDPLTGPDTAQIPSQTPVEFELQTPLKQDSIRFYPEDLIYASAEGNYVHLVLDRNGNPHKELVRCTLSSLDEQLYEWTFLFRTHRAHLVNVKKVSKLSSGMGGTRAVIPSVNMEIPVARSRVAAFKKLLIPK